MLEFINKRTEKESEKALEYFELAPGKSIGVCKIGCPAFDHAYTIMRAYREQAKRIYDLECEAMGNRYIQGMVLDAEKERDEAHKKFLDAEEKMANIINELDETRRECE